MNKTKGKNHILPGAIYFTFLCAFLYAMVLLLLLNFPTLQNMTIAELQHPRYMLENLQWHSVAALPLTPRKILVASQVCQVTLLPSYPGSMPNDPHAVRAAWVHT